MDTLSLKITYRLILKSVVLLSFCILFFPNKIASQETKLPLTVKSGHLHSEWTINNTIQAQVMLETGFPTIIIKESFALKHLKGIVKMELAPLNTYIKFWGAPAETKVTFVIKDTLIINGKKLYIDALVADFSTQKSWNNRDIVFPLKDLKSKVEININENYMVVNKAKSDNFNGFKMLSLNYDHKVKGLYLTTSIQVFDSLNSSESLSGNFLLDIGAANAIYINRNLNQVETFINLSSRMIMHDSSRVQQNSISDLAIIIPKKTRLENIIFTEDFIVGMKMYGGRSANYTGMIGNRFFEKFVVIFDFDNNKVYLKPNTDKVLIIE